MLTAWTDYAHAERVSCAELAVAPTFMMPDFTPDWTVLGYALVLAYGLHRGVCTIAPAMRAWRQPLLPPLKAGEQSVIPRPIHVLTRALVVVQMAFSVLLVTCAGLAFRSLFLVGGFDSGFDTRTLLLVTVNTAGSRDKRCRPTPRLLETLRMPADARSTDCCRSATRGGTRAKTGAGNDVRIPGSSHDPVRAELNDVGPNYFGDARRALCSRAAIPRCDAGSRDHARRDDQ